MKTRAARAGDAASISGLYQEAYRPEGGGDPRDHYPFPQFLEQDGVLAALAGGEVCWVAAEKDGEIVGSAAAVRNIGGRDDRVAEVFGVVVARSARGRGIGGSLVKRLVAELGSDPKIVLCEARTACAAGWKVARFAGFLPLGFEPFAHTTPAGSEAMLLTGRMAPEIVSCTHANAASQSARSLINAVLRVGNAAPAGTGWAKECAAGRNGFESPAPPMHPIAITRDDQSGAAMLAALPDDQMHRSGVIGLRRLEGDDPGGRYDRRHYVATLNEEVIGCLRVVIDTIDRRARILQLHTRQPGIQPAILSHVVDELQRGAAGGRLVIVLDVCEDAGEVQAALERLKFVPTVYYPALIVKGSQRLGGLQFTRLHGCDFSTSVDSVNAICWSAAQQLIEQVGRGFGSMQQEPAEVLRKSDTLRGRFSGA